ncbi:MAG: DVU0524 family FlgM-associated protein [Desulfosoma sp.]|uniref:DVU0524 family FlgM-associated protein n=1 Tax=Desulfosoma sp. TaxID=2603217 RepID=UPI00404A7CEE
MVITDYHVQSVLRTYTRQLQKSRLAAVFGGGERTEGVPEEKVTISEEARRRLIRDRVTNQVLEKQGYEEIANRFPSSE